MVICIKEIFICKKEKFHHPMLMDGCTWIFSFYIKLKIILMDIVNDMIKLRPYESLRRKEPSYRILAMLLRCGSLSLMKIKLKIKSTNITSHLIHVKYKPYLFHRLVRLTKYRYHAYRDKRMSGDRACYFASLFILHELSS